MILQQNLFSLGAQSLQLKLLISKCCYLVGKTSSLMNMSTVSMNTFKKRDTSLVFAKNGNNLRLHENKLTPVNDELPLITPNKNQFISPLVYQLLSSIRSFTALAGLMSWAQLGFQNQTTRRKWHMLDLPPGFQS